ncbi:MAG TPA: ThuA domain-containing protein [Sphingomicrobium sp.]|nr:ThuA domain-containing protein [Sphingomicrobium sp.]
MRRLILLLLTFLIAAPASAADHGAILIFSGTTGYRHESIPAGIAAVTAIAEKRGLSVEASEDPNVFSPDSLKRFRAIVLLSCTTDPKDPASEWLTGSRRDALQQFVRRGGGVLAIHAAADSHYHWPWYGELIGAHFARHPQGTPTGTVRTLATGETRSRTDEWYYFDDYDPTSHLLVTLDPQSIGEKDVNPNPMSWTRKVEGGRVFYTAMGHTTASYSEPWFLNHLADGFDWVMGEK